MTKSKLLCFSPGGEKLAHSGPDGVLRIWNTTSGDLEHEYQPAEHLKATTSCIKYSNKNVGSHSLIAMGTLAGTILLYSAEEAEVKATFEHSTNQAIMDVAWFGSDRLVSLARDSTVVIWDVETEKKDVIEKVCEGTAMCLFGKKTIVLGSYKIQVLMQQNSGGVKVKHGFTGHATLITKMLSIRKREKTSSDQYFVSSSVDDRFIYAWSTGNNTEGPICSFMVKDTVSNMAVSDLQDSSLTLAAVTHKGALVLFTHHLNGNVSAKAIKPVGTLQIHNATDKKKAVIPIVAAYFCNDSENSIIVVYNRASVFTFERMSIEKIVGSQVLIRAEPTTTKSISLLKTVTPEVTKEAAMVGPLHTAEKSAKVKRKRSNEDNVASLPMEERLNVLALEPSGSKETGRSPASNDFAQLLLQGLHSKDQNILRSVFDRGDMKVINRTVRRLPVQAVVPLIEQLSVAILGKGHKNANHVKWVRSVLYNHMSHLTTVPDRQELMQSFFNISAARMSTFSQVTQLHARLDLMLTHVAARQQEVKQKDTEPEALLVYRDESSDEEDLMDNVLGVSESEDNWDEMSDLTDLNGPTDEETDMEVDNHPSGSKRKINGDDLDENDIDEESSEDEEDDEDTENEVDSDEEADMNGDDSGDDVS
ncbi:hypothetical protein SK128_017017 [Halocaridina rubra]|uniref:Small-subunit processome Utp12 domain-containing protein n=1 Tax=Halocaridina rubra TaxID=373956 RepID=A0AAN8X4D9_HALRR